MTTIKELEREIEKLRSDYDDKIAELEHRIKVLEERPVRSTGGRDQ